MKISVGAAQLNCVPLQIDENLRAMERLAKSAEGVCLLAFPELCVCGYSCFDRLHEVAEPVGGRSMQRIAQVCKQLSMCIAYGFALREGGRVYNACAVIDEKGELLGLYRKVHLFDKEREYFTPGECFEPFNTKFGKLGLLICWDLAFPEAARTLMLKGAELLVSCSAWEYPYSENYTLASRVRAYENCLVHIASNRVGDEPDISFIGESAVYQSGGAIVSALNHRNEGIAKGVIDTNANKDEYPFRECRSEKAYTL